MMGLRGEGRGRGVEGRKEMEGGECCVCVYEGWRGWGVGVYGEGEGEGQG